MPLFNGQAIGTVVLVAVLTVVAIAFAVVGYVEWSSWAAMAEFISATSASDHSNESSTAVEFNRGTGCPVRKRKLPTGRYDYTDWRSLRRPRNRQAWSWETRPAGDDGYSLSRSTR
jgi:hypothetical protein